MKSAFSLHLNTPAGGAEIEVVRVFTETADTQTVTLTAAEFGIFRAETTEEALLQLAMTLPEGCSLRCCLSCLHGNFCSVGNEDNEIFCVTDFEPKSKEDLFRVTEDHVEREKRRRTLFQCCPKFGPLSDDFYTYR